MLQQCFIYKSKQSFFYSKNKKSRITATKTKKKKDKLFFIWKDDSKDIFIGLGEMYSQAVLDKWLQFIVILLVFEWQYKLRHARTFCLVEKKINQNPLSLLQTKKFKKIKMGQKLTASLNRLKIREINEKKGLKLLKDI